MNIAGEIREEVRRHYEQFKRWPTHISFGPECIKSWPKDDYLFPQLGGLYLGMIVRLSPEHGNSFSVGRM